MFRGPEGAGKPSMRKELRRIADFYQREADIVTATLLFLTLHAVCIIPISQLHAQLVVNYAYAAKLRLVQNRTRLMIAVFHASFLDTPRRLLASGLCCP